MVKTGMSGVENKRSSSLPVKGGPSICAQPVKPGGQVKNQYFNPGRFKKKAYP
jgi:hypothetical protein